MSARIISTLCGAAVVTLSTGLLYAAPVVVLDDKFDDGDRTNGVDPLDSQWYVLSNTAPAPSGGISAASNALVVRRNTASGNGFNPQVVTTFTPQTLVSDGDSIAMSFSFRSIAGNISRTPAQQQNAIRFGLYNGGGTNLATDLAALPPPTGATYQNDLGYSVFAPHKGLTTDPVELFARNAVGNNNALPVSAAANTLIPGSSNPLGIVTNEATTYDAGLKLTRTASGLDYEIQYAGQIFAGSTTTVTSYTFDTFFLFTIINADNAERSLTFDNALVTYTAVPEPASLAVIGLAGTAFLRRRRS